MRKDVLSIALGAITLSLGAIAIWEGIRLGYTINVDESGVGLFPLLVGVALIVCALLQLFTSLGGSQQFEALTAAQWRMVGAVFAGLVGYAAMVDVIGYPITTCLFVLYQVRLLGGTTWLKAIGCALLTAVVFTFVFKIWMQMPLASGLLEFVGVY